MIDAILVFNSDGKPRISKFYERKSIPEQQALIAHLHSVVSSRNERACNFITLRDSRKAVYRKYATLYFVFVIDRNESELAVLDLIQVFVESLDQCFKNVCELDLVFHFDQVYHILDQIVTGGLVTETSIAEISRAYREELQAADPS